MKYYSVDEIACGLAVLVADGGKAEPVALEQLGMQVYEGMILYRLKDGSYRQSMAEEKRRRRSKDGGYFYIGRDKA